MRSLWVCVAVVSLIGCGDFDKALNEPARPVMTPTGIASGSDISDVQKATGGGTTAPAANPQPAAAPDANAAVAPPAKSIIGRTTIKIVDLAEAKKNPKIVEVEKKDLGSDPLTVSFNAYVSITSRASILNFKHQMDILKATNDDKYPTFKETEKLMKELNIRLAELPQYQLYGYDAKSGAIVLLEDKEEKIRLYKANGIAIDEADKPFDVP